MKYISVIESFYPSFSKQEKKVADFILSEQNDVCIMSLEDITKKIDVSKATIFRVVKKLGFKGFIEFKLEVAREFSTVEQKYSEDYIENIEMNILETIKSSKALIDRQSLDDAIVSIEKSKKMYIFGVGSSGVAGEELQNRFMRFGKIAHSVCDTHFQVMYASTTSKEDVIVAISLSGETKDLVYPLTLAKERGCKIIVITNYIMATIAKIGDIVLLTAGKENPLNGGSLVSKISQLYIIDILATGYALRNKNKAEQTRQDIAKSIAMMNK